MAIFFLIATDLFLYLHLSRFLTSVSILSLFDNFRSVLAIYSVMSIYLGIFATLLLKKNIMCSMSGIRTHPMKQCFGILL